MSLRGWMFVTLVSLALPAGAKDTIGLSVSTLNNPFFVTLRDGARAAAELDKRGEHVTVIDVDQRAFNRLPGTFGGVTVRGSGSDEDILRGAGADLAGDRDDTFVDRNLQRPPMETDPRFLFQRGKSSFQDIFSAGHVRSLLSRASLSIASTSASSTWAKSE